MSLTETTKSTEEEIYSTKARKTEIPIAQARGVGLKSKPPALKKNDTIRRLLKPYLWDYNTNPLAFYFFTKTGKYSGAMPLDLDRSIIRLLERMPWYDLIDLFGLPGLKKMITRERICFLRDPLLKEQYEFARQLLHKEPVSISGWRPEYRKKIKATLLSDRRYRP
jgi:hypothetical protein